MSGLRPLLALHPPLSPFTHHRDNVTAPHGCPNLRVGYTPAMPRREDHEIHKGHVVALGKKINNDHSYQAQQLPNNIRLLPQPTGFRIYNKGHRKYNRLHA